MIGDLCIDFFRFVDMQGSMDHYDLTVTSMSHSKVWDLFRRLKR